MGMAVSSTVATVTRSIRSDKEFTFIVYSRSGFYYIEPVQ